MKDMIGRIVVVAFAVVGLFTAGLLGTLGSRGMLKREALAEMFADPEAEKDAEHGAAEGDHAAGPNAEHGSEAGAEHGEGGHAGIQSTLDNAPKVLASAPLDKFLLPSPFSTEQTAQLFEELEATRSEVRSRLVAVKQQEKDLDLVRADLDRRWDELDKREQELEEKDKSIAAERDELSNRTVLLAEAEMENLSSFAKKIEKMKSDKAAALLEQKDPAEVAKVLSFVKDREAGKIMESLSPQFMSKVAEKAIGIIRPTSVGGAGLAGDAGNPKSGGN